MKLGIYIRLIGISDPTLRAWRDVGEEERKKEKVKEKEAEREGKRGFSLESK